MYFYLNNEHRKYMGLKLLNDNYDLVKIKKNNNEEFYLFFDQDTIVKIIHYYISSGFLSMIERDVHYETTHNRTVVLPKTSKGRQRKLTGSVVDSLNGFGNYFSIYRSFEEKYAYAMIGNYTTQRAFYEDHYIENCNTLDDIKEWCDHYVGSSTELDLKEVEEFSREKRKHVKYQEGDYFRVKLGRRKYTYGRILLDVYKGQKNHSLSYWDILFGRPLIIEMFHILTDRKDVTIEELKNCKVFPSQHILHNNIYYGDYEIIGHGLLPEKIAYPIMYGKSISGLDPNKIIFQCGKIHIETPYEKEKLLGDYRKSGIGFNILTNEKIIEQCLKDNSNLPYWEYYKLASKDDLRCPSNRKMLIQILNYYHLDYLLELYDM